MQRRTSNARPRRRTLIAAVLAGPGALFLGVAPVAIAAPTDTVPAPGVGNGGRRPDRQRPVRPGTLTALPGAGTWNVP